MTHIGQSYRDLEQGPATIRAFRSLTQNQTNAVSKAVRRLPPGWSADGHDDYHGYLSILISPTEPRKGWPSFLISGTTESIELAEIRNEELNEIGSFTNVEAASAQLVTQLTAAMSAIPI